MLATTSNGTTKRSKQQETNYIVIYTKDLLRSYSLFDLKIACIRCTQYLL